MSQQNIETTTIVRDEKTIIIAHPNLKPQPTMWQTFTQFFASNQQTSASTAQLSHTSHAVQPIVEQSSVSFEIKPVQTVVQVVTVETLPVVQDTSSWTDYFSRQNIVLIFVIDQASYHNSLNEQMKSLEGIDDRLSTSITKFKEQKLMNLGDVRVRSILMAFSSAVMYKLVSANTVGFFRKTRNLVASFIFMGYWFVPELFNPFLKRPTFAQNIV